MLETKSDVIFENGTADAQRTHWYTNLGEYYVTALQQQWLYVSIEYRTHSVAWEIVQLGKAVVNVYSPIRQLKKV